MNGAPAMSFSASASASASGWVSTVLFFVTGFPQLRGDPEARQVVQRHHRLIGAYVPGMRDPPPAVLAALVPVLVEGRARDHDAVLGGDHCVLERPGAAGRVPVHADLGLACAVHGDDVRPEFLPQEPDDL